MHGAKEAAMRYKRGGSILAFSVIILLIFPANSFSSGHGRLYIVGMGPAFPDLLTLRAVRVINEADVLICAKDIEERFPGQVKGKSILLDPLEYLQRYHGKYSWELPEEERKRWEGQLTVKREKAVGLIRKEIEKGRTVAYLDYGDPCIYGISGWLVRGGYFDKDEIEVVPGISFFNAASALLKRGIACNGSIILTCPKGLRGGGLQKGMMKEGATTIIFMGLRKTGGVLEGLREFYPAETPVAVVYEAGYQGKEKIVEGYLSDIQEKIKDEKEKHLGLIYIGPALR